MGAETNRKNELTVRYAETQTEAAEVQSVIDGSRPDDAAEEMTLEQAAARKRELAEEQEAIRAEFAEIEKAEADAAVEIDMEPLGGSDENDEGQDADEGAADPDDDDGATPTVSAARMAELEAAADAGHAGAKPPKSQEPHQAGVNRAAIKVARAGVQGGTEFHGELTTMAEVAAAFRKAKTPGKILGYERFDADRARAEGMLIHAGLGDDATAELVDRARGVCADHGVMKATCGCAESCPPVINIAPYVFCTFGNEVTGWQGLTRIPMEECKMALYLPTKREPYEWFEWEYCFDTGELDPETGEPVYVTGVKTYDDEGNPVVKKPYDPADPGTWKPTNRLNIACDKKKVFTIAATGIAFDVPRAERLCNGPKVARELQNGTADLGKAEATKLLTAMDSYATEFGYAFSGDGSAAINGAAGLLSILSSDVLDDLVQDECMDWSEYDAFVVGWNDKWEQLEQVRKGEGLTGVADILGQCFGDVIPTRCRPAGYTPPEGSEFTPTPGEVQVIEPAACTRTIKVILARRGGWIEGMGEDFSIRLDRADKQLAVGNAEFHMYETESVYCPAGAVSSVTFDLTINNKGQCTIGAEPVC